MITSRAEVYCPQIPVQSLFCPLLAVALRQQAHTQGPCSHDSDGAAMRQ